MAARDGMRRDGTLGNLEEEGAALTADNVGGPGSDGHKATRKVFKSEQSLLESIKTRFLALRALSKQELAIYLARVSAEFGLAGVSAQQLHGTPFFAPIASTDPLYLDDGAGVARRAIESGRPAPTHPAMSQMVPASAGMAGGLAVAKASAHALLALVGLTNASDAVVTVILEQFFGLTREQQRELAAEEAKPDAFTRFTRAAGDSVSGFFAGASKGLHYADGTPVGALGKTAVALLSKVPHMALAYLYYQVGVGTASQRFDVAYDPNTHTPFLDPTSDVSMDPSRLAENLAMVQSVFAGIGAAILLHQSRVLPRTCSAVASALEKVGRGAMAVVHACLGARERTVDLAAVEAGAPTAATPLLATAARTSSTIANAASVSATQRIPSATRGRANSDPGAPHHTPSTGPESS